MSAPAPHAPPAPAMRDRPYTVGAFLSLLVYLVWLPLMFALGSLLAAMLGYEPGMNESVGFWPLAVNVLVAVLVVPLPSWVGAGLAFTGRRLGGGTAANIALALCLLVGVALLVMSLPLHGV